MGEQTTTQLVNAGVLSPPVESAVLQRKCDCGNHTIAGAECDSCKKEKGRGNTLQRARTNADAVDEVPQIVREVLSSSGQPLDAATRNYFEPRFGRDFTHVRIHADSRAAKSAQAVSAHAYTVGNHIVFGGAKFHPQKPESRKLLAHELTHTIQQQGMSSWFGGKLEIGAADDSYERQADLVAEQVTQNNGVRLQSSPLNAPALLQTLRLQRDYDDLSINQLRRLAATDPQAAEALRLRYRAMSNIELERFARNDPMAQSVFADRQVVAPDAEGQGRFGRSGMQESLSRDIQQERLRIQRAGGTPRRAPSAAIPGGRTEGGTVGAARTDIPGLEGRAFIGRSPRAGGAVNPASRFPPATDPAVLPQTHGHAEQAIADQLEQALRSVPREQLAGRRVWMLIEQEPCATCAQGTAEATLPAGVLRRLSEAFPEVTFEVKNLDSSALMVLRNGQRVAQGATPAAAAAATEPTAPAGGAAAERPGGSAAAERPSASTAVAERPGGAPAATETPGAAAAPARTPGTATAVAERPTSAATPSRVQVGTEIRALSVTQQPNGTTIAEIEYIFGENLEHINRGAPTGGEVPNRMLMRVTQNADGSIAAVESLSGQPQAMAEALVRQTLPRALSGEIGGAEAGLAEGAAAGTRGMARLAQGLKIGGWAAFIVITGYQLATAAPGQQPRVLAQAGGGLGGGMLTSYLVCNVLLDIETFGWGLVICGFVAGGVGGYASSELTGEVYDEATRTELDAELARLETAPRNVRVLFNVLVGNARVDASFVRRFLALVPSDLRDYELVILAGQLGPAPSTPPPAPAAATGAHPELTRVPAPRAAVSVDTVCPNCHRAAGERRTPFGPADLSDTDVQSISSWIASQPQQTPAAPSGPPGAHTSTAPPARPRTGIPSVEEQRNAACPGGCHQAAGEQRRPDFNIPDIANLQPTPMESRLDTLRTELSRLPERQRAPGDIAHRPSPSVPAAVQTPARPATPRSFPTVREQLGDVCPSCHREAGSTRPASPMVTPPRVTDQDLARVARWIQSQPPAAAQPATGTHTPPAGVPVPRPAQGFPSVAEQQGACPSCHQTPSQARPLSGSTLDRVGGTGTSGQMSEEDRRRMIEWIQAVEQSP
jgi:uncharacterized protein DUF4157